MITRACVELKEPSAQQWYLEERADLKKLPTWENFAQRVRLASYPPIGSSMLFENFTTSAKDPATSRTMVNDLQGSQEPTPRALD